MLAGDGVGGVDALALQEGQQAGQITRIGGTGVRAQAPLEADVVQKLVEQNLHDQACRVASVSRWKASR